MTSVNELDLAAVREQLRLALAKKGEEYVYEFPPVWEYDDADRLMLVETGECQYVRDDLPEGPAPSCLWGHVLVGMGVSIESLRVCEGTRIDEVSVTPWADDLIDRAARESQRRQDNGETWGAAVQAFEDYIKAASR